jgi:hypothetical protein
VRVSGAEGSLKKSWGHPGSEEWAAVGAVPILF